MRSFGLSLLLAVTGVSVTAGAAPAKGTPGIGAPATFRGRLPCADCSGVDVTLTLRADHTYAVRNDYVGRPHATFFESGTWRVLRSASALVLTPARVDERPTYYRIESPATITQLDASGDRIASKLNFSLRRAATVVALAPAGGHGPSKPMGMDGFAGPMWSVVALNGAPVHALAEAKVPELRFDGVDHRVSGSTGCNTLAGTYTAAADGLLHVSPLATTRMACIGAGAQERETAFLAALAKVTGFRIDAGELHLLANETVVVTLRATP